MGRVVRYKMPDRSRLWVTYGLVTNACDKPIRLHVLSAQDATAGRYVHADLDSARVVPHAPSGPPPHSFLPAGAKTPGRALGGYDLRSGQSVEIRVPIATVATRGEPHAVPPVRLSYSPSDETGHRTMKLPIDLRFCSCPMPLTSNNAERT
jgi:hypothetical protein